MGEALGFRTVKSARKKHRCSWCGEAIEVGQSYVKWLWVDGYDTADCLMHPECYSYFTDGEDEYFTPFSNERPVVEAGKAGW